jgi:hypothetical protein
MVKEISIGTNLLKKEETFKVLALGQAIGLPILLIGVPGVAKTQAVIDFAKAANGGTIQGNDIFLLETDEGTKSSEVKGHVDLKELTLNNNFIKDSPITKAKYVIINEIDKGSATVRNSFLGIMNEKILFDGSNKTPCIWDSFIGTCNEIPDDEVNSPFWDRFLIKHEVGRLNESEMLNYFKLGGRNRRHLIKIPLPNEAEINAVPINIKQLEKVINLCHLELSDRTLSFLPKMIKAVMLVFKMTESMAMVKTVELLVGKNKAKELSKLLVTKEVREIYDACDLISQAASNDAYNDAFDKVQSLMDDAKQRGKITKQEMEEVVARVTEESDKLDFLKSEEDSLKKAVSEELDLPF